MTIEDVVVRLGAWLTRALPDPLCFVLLVTDPKIRSCGYTANIEQGSVIELLRAQAAMMERHPEIQVRVGEEKLEEVIELLRAQVKVGEKPE